MYGSQMFRARDDLFRLFSHFDMNHIGFAALAVNYPYSSMVAPVWHALVYRWLEQDCNFLPLLVRSKDSTQPDFSSLSRLLS